VGQPPCQHSDPGDRGLLAASRLASSGQSSEQSTKRRPQRDRGSCIAFEGIAELSLAKARDGADRLASAVEGVLGGRLEVLAHWRGDELIIQEKNEFGKLVQSLSLNREGRLAVLLSLDDRRLRAPLLLLSVYDRVPAQP